MSLCFIPQNDITSDIHTTDYIQNHYEKVAIVSNTLNRAEIIAGEAENNTYSIGNNELTSEVFFIKKDFSKNTTRFSRESIHNLSTNRKNVISIRAP